MEGLYLVQQRFDNRRQEGEGGKERRVKSRTVPCPAKRQEMEEKKGKNKDCTSSSEDLATGDRRDGPIAIFETVEDVLARIELEGKR